MSGGILSRVLGMASSVAGALRRGAPSAGKRVGLERQVDEVVGILAPGPFTSTGGFSAAETKAAAEAIERARVAWKERRRAGVLLEEAMGGSRGSRAA